MTEAGFLEVTGGRIYYEAQGAGHPVLLIHGGLGSLRMWDEQAPAFSDGYRVIRYDTRGWGRTETDDVEYSDADDAAAVLDRLGEGSAHVIGQSRGGSIALDLVLRHPERVSALVSVAGGIGSYKAAGDEAREAPPWDAMERLWEAKDWNALADIETRVWVDGWGQPPTRVDPTIRRMVHGWIVDGYRAETAWGKPQPLDPPAVERLAEVVAPTLVMIGELDEASAVAAGRHLGATVANARLVSFPDVAHMIHLEDPREFNRVTLEFLAEAGEG